MNNTLTLAARLQLEARQWMQGLNQADSGTRRFISHTQAEFGRLRSFMQSTTGMLAQIGLGIGAVSVIKHSAQTDQTLVRIKQTADLTNAQVTKLRGSLHGMAQETGNTFDDLQAGFGQLVAGGLSFDQALPTIDAVNKAMRVTGSEATTLSSALQSAQANFGFDLTQPGKALELLDKMTVAGRTGVIELEDLAGVFGSAAKTAQSAGLTFDQTLAVFEGLGTATTKDRVGTLVDSTLRLFTNANYMKAASQATGVKFFDKSGAQRNPLDILQDIQAKYNTLTTDKDRFKLISQAFGKADQDTIKGLKQALSEGRLAQIRDIAKQVQGSSGTINRDFAENMGTSVAQAGVLKETLATVGDQISQPINKVLAETIQKLTAPKEKGGLGLNGWELLAGGGLLAGGTYAAGRVGGGMLGKLLANAGASGASLATGLVAGQTLKEAGAATPVYIVGAAPGLFSGAAGAGPDLPIAPRGAAGGAASKLRWLGLAGGLAVGSMAVDPRNWNPGRGVVGNKQDMDTLIQELQQRGGKKGWWLTRGGMPQLNLLEDLVGGFGKSGKGTQGEIAVTVEVKDDRTTARITRMDGVANATVRNSGVSGSTYQRATGRMMEMAR